MSRQKISMVILVILLATGIARAQEPFTSASEEDRSWHLLQKQYDGLIRSVQHGFTKHECEFAKARAMGLPATEEEKAAVKKTIDDTAARYETSRKEWEMKYPGCNYGYSLKNDPPGCPNQIFFPSNSITFTQSMHSVTDIAIAECFQ